jgi:hypothetical protein
LQEKVEIISCIYSRYDTANGFYYPLANLGRPAAGYVGLLIDGHAQLQKRGFYASLVRPPDIGVRKCYSGERIVINLDASRLINGGTIASGGGHSLIYKDDVVHLAWSVMRLTWQDDSPPNPVDTGRCTQPLKKIAERLSILLLTLKKLYDTAVQQEKL